MNLKDALYFTIERNPDREIIVDGDRRYTRAQWGKRVWGLANSLKDLGINKGDSIAIMLKTREQTAAALMALHCIGAVAAMCNPRVIAEKVKYFIKDSNAKGIIVEKDLLKEAEIALAECPECSLRISIDEGMPNWLSFEKLAASGSPKEPDVEIKDDDPGVIIYTSGATGEPKGVPITHGMSFHRVLANSIGAGCEYKTDIPKVIGLLPLFHTIGVHGVFLHAVFFDGTYFPVADFNPDKVIELIEKEKITHMFGSPTHFHVMLSSSKWDKSKAASVRDAMYAGAPMPQVQIDRCVKEITENFTHIYGSTETYFMGCFRHVGKYPGALASTIFQNVRVIKLGGNPDDVVNVGEEGEYIVELRSPETFKGYLNKPDKTAEVCKNGWYYTRDSALLKEGGRIYITGRTDDMIITGAENVHPAEVESILMKHPGIKDVAVVGTPDEKWGEIVKAFVVAKNGPPSAEELDEFMKNDKNIEAWKRPKKYQFIEAIPRTPSGKAQRFLLRQMK